jgi:predicted nucleotidyltransferase
MTEFPRKGLSPQGFRLRDNPGMDMHRLVHHLRTALPGLMAVYAFGSRVREQGRNARADSDLDLAVLVEGYADPVALFDLAGTLADLTNCPVDLLDLRAASTVMQYQILMTGERLWAKDHQASLFEAAMLTEKLHLDAARAALLEDVRRRGHVHG